MVEEVGQDAAVPFVHAPERMDDAVRGGEVEQGSFRGELFDQMVNERRIAVGQEGRAGMRMQGHDVAGAVVLFILAGLLMFLDDVFSVFVGGNRSEDAGLDMIAHFQAVNVEMFVLVEFERGLFAEAFEVGEGFGVDFIVIEVNAGFEFDFRFGNTEEAQRIAFREFRPVCWAEKESDEWKESAEC